MTTALPLLVRVLAAPAQAEGLVPADWELLLRQARSSDTLPRLAHRLADAGVPAPAAAQAHLDGAMRLATAQHAQMRRELRLLQEALVPLGLPVVLLKGAAYVADALPSAQGRLANDIDVLVPASRLDDVEAELRGHGWATTHPDAYDQAYYRRWMHELPPMEHLKRGSVLDVHHAVLPLTGRRRIDSALLLDACRPLPRWPGLQRLGDEDLVIHAAVHLLQNEVFERAFRDLGDIDLLLRGFAVDPGFFPRLASRAAQLGVASLLAPVLAAARELLHSPVPPDLLPPAPPLLRWACDRVLAPLHPSARRPGTRAALLGMFARAHWQRMPPPLLLRHALHKAWRAMRASPSRPAAPP